jgi:hypothetical protein
MKRLLQENVNDIGVRLELAFAVPAPKMGRVRVGVDAGNISLHAVHNPKAVSISCIARAPSRAVGALTTAPRAAATKSASSA